MTRASIGDSSCAEGPSLIEADLVTDLVSQAPAAFGRHPPGRGPGGEAARLEHDDASPAAQAGVQEGRGP